MKFLQNTIVLVCYFLIPTNGLLFFLTPNTYKCLKENVKKNELVRGAYEVSVAAGQVVDLIIEDSMGNILYRAENLKSWGQFSFVTDKTELFEMCFKSTVKDHRHAKPQEIFLNIEKLPEERDKLMPENLKPLEIKLKKTEFLVEDFLKDFMEMKEREKLLSDTNESTINRVKHMSIFSIGMIFVLACWQVLYMRKYFKDKKLIE